MTDILKKPHRSDPATHALVIGVSHYRHFDGGSDPNERGEGWAMGQLTSAAASAGAIAQWLKDEYHNPDAPLQTLRVLLSPQKRREKVPKSIADAVKDPSHRATRANVEKALGELRRDCATNVDNIAFVYIAGHGVQLSKHDSIVLLEDMADETHLTSLHGAIDAVGCHRGMDHAGTAQTQIWFVDACRQRPEIAEQFEMMKGALTLDELPGSATSSPLFLASSTRQAAFGRPDKQTLFCEALLDALRSGAAVGPDPTKARDWHVSTLSLNEKLVTTVRELANAEGERQTVDPGGRMTHAIVQRFPKPPPVRLQVRLEPHSASHVSSAALFLGGSTPIANVPASFPFEMSLAAGLYLLSVTTKPPFQNKSEILNLAPPKLAHAVEVV